MPIERPIFVCGLPRTGTTALHRLLNADPAHQGLELWLTEVPQPRPPRETWADNPIYAGLNAAFSEHHVENPEFMGIHFMDAGTRRGVLADPAPVRQVDRLRVARLRPGVLRLAGASRTGPTPTSGTSANLQLIGLNDPEKRWVLKNPSHLVGLDAIMSVYPDALIVQTHRDPVVAIASACSLSAEATKGWSTTFVGDTIGRTQLDMLSKAVARFERERANYPAEQFIDLDYREFVADPVGTTKGIYATFGLEWTAGVDEAVTRLDTESRQGGRRPSHTVRPRRLRAHRGRGSRRLRVTTIRAPCRGTLSPDRVP